MLYGPNRFHDNNGEGGVRFSPIERFRHDAQNKVTDELKRVLEIFLDEISTITIDRKIDIFADTQYSLRQLFKGEVIRKYGLTQEMIDNAKKDILEELGKDK